MGGLVKKKEWICAFMPLLILLPLHAENLAKSPGGEIGNGIFRPLHSIIDKHAAIYRSSDAKKDWNPAFSIEESNFQHSVIQATGVQYLLHWQDYLTFLWGWHHITATQGNTCVDIDIEKRKKIISTARSQYGAPYPSQPWTWPAIKAPKNKYTQYPNGSFRCDGIIEYCYEQVFNIYHINPDDRGFFSKLHEQLCYLSFTPTNLYMRMPLDFPKGPEVEIFINEENEIVIFSDDKQNGSGVDWIGLYIDEVYWEEGLFGTINPQIENLLFSCDDDADYVASVSVPTATLPPETNRLIAVAADRAGNFGVDTLFFSLVVVKHQPCRGDENVDIYKVMEIEFSESMDTTSARQALEIKNKKNGAIIDIREIIWSNDKKDMLIRGFDPSIENDTLGFDYFADYQVKIAATAKGNNGASLDGDKDGKFEGSPIDDYSFCFKTRKPEASLNPRADAKIVEQGNTKWNSIEILNEEPRELVFSLSDTVYNTINWYAPLINLSPFSLQPGQSMSIPYSIHNIDALQRCYHFFCLLFDVFEIDIAEHSFSPHEEKQPDHPDEGPIINPQYPTPWYLDSESEIGILLNGFYDGVGHLLGRYKINTCLLKPEDMKILGEPNRTIDSLSVLLIPSGGLSGLDNFSHIKQSFENFANQGGTIICLTQQYGYDLNLLPSPPEVYGWREDQSCWQASGYFSDWDVILSGQHSYLINAHLDGFFGDVPMGSKVIMKRRISGMPELFHYWQGAGIILICGLYTDWAYGQSQWCMDEVTLIRDMVTWAMDAARAISEYHAGEIMSLDIPIHYYPNGDTTSSNRAIVKIYSPNRDSLYAEEYVLSPPLSPGDYKIINIESYPAPQYLGIYPITYGLFADSIVLQEEKLGQRFAVKTDIPVGEYLLGDFGIWTTAESENILYGSEAFYSIFVRNSTNTPLNAKIILGIHEEGGQWWQVIDSIFLEIPPESTIIVPYSRELYKSTSTYFGLFHSEESNYGYNLGNSICRCQKGVWIFPAKCEITGNTEKSIYLSNEILKFSFKINSDITSQCSLSVKLIDDQHVCHDSLSLIALLDSTQLFTHSDSFFVSGQIPNGHCKIQVQAFLNSKQIGIGRHYFAKREALMNCKLIPDSIISGQDTMRFAVEMVPDSIISTNSTLQFTLFCPTHKISDTIHFDSISNNETLLVPIDIPGDSICFGRYTFKYQLDSFDTLDGNCNYENTVTFGLNTSASTFHWKDTLHIDFFLKNLGCFSVPICMIAEVEKPNENYKDSTLINMNTETDTLVHFQTVIDSGIPDSIYRIFLRTRSGNSTIEKRIFFRVEVDLPEILISADTTHYSANDTATIVLFNAGQLEADVRLTEVYLHDLQTNQFPLDTARFTIPPKDFAFFKFKVPEVMSGPYYLFIKGNEEEYNLPISDQLYLWVNGIEAKIVLKTSRDIYLPADSVLPQINFINGNYPFDGAIELSIIPAGWYPGDTTFTPGDEDTWPIDHWSSPGCTLIENQIMLTGKDMLYEVSSWGIEPDGGRDGKGITSKEEMVLKLLNAKRNKERGSEPIRYAAMASHNGELYAAITTDVRRKILGPYPYFYGSSYDLSEIASIYQFSMDESYFYIADIDSGYIYKALRSSGEIVNRWKSTHPEAIAVYDNSLYILDGMNHLIMKSDLNGDTLLVFGSDSLSTPTDLEIDDSGTIFISDPGKNKVLMFDLNGNCTGVKVAGNFSRIAIDEVGYLYGADLDSMKLAKYDASGVLIEYYQWGTFPDEIAACDDLIHKANIYTTQWHDFLLGDVLKNYGRFEGYSNTKDYVCIPATFVTDFIPTQNGQSGSVNWYFSFSAPVKEREEQHWIPIDSIGFFNLEEEDAPTFKAVLANPSQGTSPDIEKFELHYITRQYGNTVWEDTFELKYMPYDSLSINKNAGVFADTGEFIFFGNITLDNGQHYSSPRMHNFYIKPSPLSIALRTDREIYYPNENVIAMGIVVNNGETTLTNLEFEILKRTEPVLDTLIFSLDPEKACTVTTVLTDSAPFVLSGTVPYNSDTLREYKAVEVELPPLMFSTTFPCSVDHKPFEATTEITNWWRREVDVLLRTVCGDSQFNDSFMLLSEESKELSHFFEIRGDDTLVVELLHPFAMLKNNEIRFGERVEIAIDSIITSEVNPTIPYGVINTGEFDCLCELLFSVADSNSNMQDSIAFTNLVPIGDTLSGEWNPTLEYGDYTLNWIAYPESSTVILSEGTIPITITEPNQVTIDSIALQPKSDSIGQLCFDIFVSNNSANTFVGNIGLFSDFIYETKGLELDPLEKCAIKFLSNAVLEQGLHGLTGKILQNGCPINEYSDSLKFLSEVSIAALPNALTFAIGDSGFIPITTCNSGTAIGEQQLYFDFGEFGNETRDISLIPGEQKTDSFFIYIPEDLEELTYYASVWLGNDEFIIPVHILGYKILVNGYLNQFNYAPGDTVQLSIEVDNENERILKGFCVTNYNGEPITQDFLLSGYSNNIDFGDPEFIKSTGDTGQYVSSIIWCGNFDSVSIEAEGTGGFDFAARILESDTIHYSFWYAESTIIGQSNGLQFRASFFDPLSNLERVHIAYFDSAGVTDTTIETFSPPGIIRTSIYPFDEWTNIMFFGVYTSTGRGLWLNTVHIFPANDTCNIVTDKQRYGMGDTVTATVQSPFTGKLNWNVDFYEMGEAHDSLDIDSVSNQFEFAIPEELASGTHEIEFSFDIEGDTAQRFSTAQPFDVMGYQVSVYECRLDTNEYPPGDSMDVRFKLQSSHSIPITAKLQFMQQYQWYEGLICTLNIDSGFNVTDLSLQVPDIHRGIAFLDYSFHKDSIFLAHSSQGFVVHIPDSVSPVAYFIEKPSNTYNPHIDHIVSIFAQDETELFDTLFYHNGYMWQGVSNDHKHGDTLTYKIPAQPRGTHIAYYVDVQDGFGNTTRLPETDFEQFCITGQLPPSDCETDTVDQTVNISWGAPSEFLKYHSGYPYESKEDTFAVRITPQFIPGSLTELSIYVQKSEPDTGILTARFYSNDNGNPGIELHPPLQIEISDPDPHWIDASIDSIELNEEIFIVFWGTGVFQFGDRNKSSYRTLRKQGSWNADTAFGNLLCHPRCFYEPESTFYRVFKEDSLQYLLIADSLTGASFIDSNVTGECYYRYLIKTHYMIPNLNATSPVLSQMFDYIPPQFGDSVSVIETDSVFVVACEVTDGIGISFDSLIYTNIAITHDSITGNCFWYTIPKSGQPIPYYLVATDSATNSSRNPDSGFFYISPPIPEGFSGHIAQDTIWESDIIVNGDVWIDPGVTLAIEGAVHVLVVPHFDAQKAGIDTTLTEFIVQGDLDLFASESFPVVFTSYANQPQSGDWYGIRFEDAEKRGFPIGSMETNYESNVRKQSLRKEKTTIPEEELLRTLPVEMEMNRAMFEKTKKVWRKYGEQRCCITDISNTRIEYAKRALVYQQQGFHTVQNAVLKHNSECGIAIEESISWIIIENADMEFSNIGIASNAALWVWGGSIKECDGVGVSYAGWDGFAYGTQFINNGIGIQSTGSSFPFIWNCELKQNSIGLCAEENSRPHITKSSITESDSLGIYISDNAKPNLGGRGHNHLFGSGCYDVYNNTPNRISAKNNYWGTMDIDSIEAHIYDYYDNDSLGAVIVEPLWDGDQHLGGPMSEGQGDTPPVFDLKAPSPNPFSRTTTITYAIPQSGNISLKIYDITGKCIRILEDGIRQCGLHTIAWDGTDHHSRKIANGIYFIRLASNDRIALKKILIMK
jgi:hypothetical protein